MNKESKFHTVQYTNFEFEPQILIIRKNDIVSWKIGKNVSERSSIYNETCGEERFFVLQIVELDIESDNLKINDTFSY